MDFLKKVDQEQRELANTIERADREVPAQSSLCVKLACMLEDGVQYKNNPVSCLTLELPNSSPYTAQKLPLIW